MIIIHSIEIFKTQEPEHGSDEWSLSGSESWEDESVDVKSFSDPEGNRHVYLISKQVREAIGNLPDVIDDQIKVRQGAEHIAKELLNSINRETKLQARVKDLTEKLAHAVACQGGYR